MAPLCIAAYGLAGDLTVFVGVRVIHGAFGGFLMAALFALLADVAPEGERGRTIGRAGALIGLVAVIGPAGAGLAASRLGSSPVFLGVAVILLVGFLIVWRLVPETLPETERETEVVGAWRRLLNEPRLRVAYLAIFGLEAGVGGGVLPGLADAERVAGGGRGDRQDDGDEDDRQEEAADRPGTRHVPPVSPSRHHRTSSAPSIG